MTKQKIVQKAESFTVKVVRALPGGKFQDGAEFHCDDPASARHVADRLQGEFDDDADACRAYVYPDDDFNVPIYAGRQRPREKVYRGRS